MFVNDGLYICGSVIYLYPLVEGEFRDNLIVPIIYIIQLFNIDYYVSISYQSSL